MEDYKRKFLTRTLKHIERVNKYASKINESYPNHDSDKLSSLYEGYSLMSKEKPTKEDKEKISAATLTHITSNEHHPEYWTTDDVSKFTRDNPITCECYKMPESAMKEMCCDWCAMSEEFGNTPQEWANKVINKRWKFTKWQESYIYHVLS